MNESTTNGGTTAGAVGTDLYDDGASMNQQPADQQSTSNLRSELSNLKSDLDALLSRASTLSDTELKDARDRLMNQFNSMRQTAQSMAGQASKQLSHGVDVTTDYVKQKPLQSVAIAAGVGLLVGALLRRQ